MNDAVDRVISEREALDRGFPRSLTLSLLAHLLIAGAGFAAPLLLPQRPPKLNVAMGHIVPLPPGGGGVPNAPEPAPAPVRPDPPKPEPPKQEAKPAPTPKIVKPPQKEPPKKQGLPEPEAKKRRTKPTPTPEPASQAGAPGGSGSTTPGFEFLPPGAGVPGGTDLAGDWYLAGVQRKIWMIWNQQLRSGPAPAVIVSFAILADGSVDEVRVVQSSGSYLLDNSAQRAIYSAAPFGPLPKHYETNRFTIQALFKPLR